MAKYLTEDILEELYAKYETPERVKKHCLGVSRAAVTIGKALNENGYNFDLELLKWSGLVHDLIRTKEHHGELAAEVMEGLGCKEIADVVRNHMHYQFNPISSLNETDLMCLADRLVLEDRYQGIDKRIEYLIHKPGETEERTKRLLIKKEETVKYMNNIEKIIGQTIDSLFV